MISSHVALVLQEIVCDIEIRLERLQRIRDDRFICWQAHEFLNEFLKCDSACWVCEVECLYKLCLVENGYSFDTGVRRQKREGVFRREVFADRTTFVQSQTIRCGYCWYFAPWMTLQVFTGLKHCC